MKTGIVVGNFDVLHPGYIAMFNETKKHCDFLIVALHKDPSINNKTKLKPILSIEERINILYSLNSVHKIIPYNTEEELYELLIKEKPDIRFMGDDYINKKFTGDDLNIPIVIIDRSHGWSTTKYKKLICESLNYE